ncbi:hypothetical protein DSM43518_05013 [Mycobacterium marinum]|nr:hypothetical protein [Mycobacterium marinum]AXN45022.1 hypothetical protein MM1218R_03086 [Mycobacterium marinum]AXN50361.1 hypothetical protein CCUG20998_02956 [Mycobacterium marinum]EPQ80755.1 hypothetical protein MMEU_1280 [Mycobacterium marinum str. Europe]RFZ01469.1 hypothetical protein VIMS_05715 [Mycobacterium marinum]RFZ02528.1 hypothetical protein DSM43518_05013 [Mycobacterium marinum]
MTINSVPESYGHATGMPAPIPLAPGPVHPGGTSPVDAAMAGFGMATNADLGPVNGEIAADDADRRAHAADAAAKFPANEADAAQQFQGVGADGMAQMIPQMASGIGGALSGALGGVLGPLTQVPQQALQAGQGALQPLMGALQQSAGVEGLEAADGARLVDSLESEPGLGGGGAGELGTGGGGGGGGTIPTGYLGPPPVPTSSPPTTPAGAPTKPASTMSTGGTPSSSTPMGATGMPMMPPGAMGAGGTGGSKEKPAEKRVTAPGVPNGQPVKGRLTVPPSVPVKSVDGKPPVVTRSTRRILLPDRNEIGRNISDEKTDGSE